MIGIAAKLAITAFPNCSRPMSQGDVLAKPAMTGLADCAWSSIAVSAEDVTDLGHMSEQIAKT